eukprot:m51a1_g9943 putative cathepsin b (327) ;mRNA; r:13175-14354
MRTAIVALLALAAVACADDLFVSERRALIEKVNAVQSSWVASADAPTALLTDAEARPLLGTLLGKDPHPLPEKLFSERELAAAPESFDAREAWPHCTTIRDIRDQSICGSCWAFGAVEAMSDRECVHNHRNVSLSSEDMLSCNPSAGSCDGGWPSSAFDAWKSNGVVTEECAPYSFPSCDHHIKNSTNPCPTEEDSPTPSCPKACAKGYPTSFTEDKHYGADVYSVSGEAKMMAELSSNGPCEASIDVYEDFMAYTSGVYHHVSGGMLGGHAIKILGYGTENGVKYWLLANSWNPHWGMNGYFKMRRGNNECGIEDEMNCGIPKSI